jgi:hypothetical protein
MKSKLNIIAIAAVTILNSLICGSVNAKPLPQLDLKTLTEPIIPENSVYGVVKIKTLSYLSADTTCENITVNMVSRRRFYFPGIGASSPLFSYSNQLSGGWVINTSAKKTRLPNDCYYLITFKKGELREEASLSFLMPLEFGFLSFRLCSLTDGLLLSEHYITLDSAKRVDFTTESHCIGTRPR